MSGLFPKLPAVPSADAAASVCEWVMPRYAEPERQYFRACVALPPGRPDYLAVSTEVCDEGRERTVAAVYGQRVWLIHYSLERG